MPQRTKKFLEVKFGLAIRSLLKRSLSRGFPRAQAKLLALDYLECAVDPGGCGGDMRAAVSRSDDCLGGWDMKFAWTAAVAAVDAVHAGSKDRLGDFLGDLVSRLDDDLAGPLGLAWIDHVVDRDLTFDL